MDLKKSTKLLGPGLIHAGAAVGVSHLVQSTQAGAQFGLVLIWAVILAHVFKYTSFEFSFRYTSATGENLLHGYKRLGSWAIILFVLASLSTMFTIQAAVTLVTAGIVENITGLSYGTAMWSFILLTISSIFLYGGQYKYLNSAAKFVIPLLSVVTLISLALSFNISTKVVPGEVFTLSRIGHLTFLVALIGWMPGPIDTAIWTSLWSVEKQKSDGKITSLKDALLDFRVGFAGTLILGVCFVMLGSNVLYGSGETLAAGSVKFSAQLISLYTKNLGAWSAPFIGLAAFLTMFSTTVTCLDAFPRVVNGLTKELGISTPDHQKRDYLGFLLLMVIATMVILIFFVKDMRAMVNFATIVAFVTAPLLALLNYLSVTTSDFPKTHKVAGAYKLFAIISLCVLFGFALFYLWMKFLS